MNTTEHEYDNRPASDTLDNRYQLYLDMAGDENGIDCSTGEPLLTFDEWLNK